MLAGDAADAGADGEFRFVGRVPDRHHEFVDVLRALDDDLLAGRVFLRSIRPAERVGKRVRELARAVAIVGPAEHLVDDVHVAEQVGDDAVVRLALDVVEQHRAAAVHVLLKAGDLEIGIDFLVGLDQVALRLSHASVVRRSTTFMVAPPVSRNWWVCRRNRRCALCAHEPVPFR
jgi:hypothetical protein